MHRLLETPELVGAILAVVTEDHLRVLRNCLFVNHLFSHEAIRILWDKCGTDFPIDNTRWKQVQVRDLAEIAAGDVQRAQYYATFIRELHFVWAGGEDFQDQWYTSLLCLNFPTLEHFMSDDCTGTLTGPDTTPEELKTAGPFYDFTPKPVPISERVGLFWHVLRNSPKLKTIDLALDAPGSLQSVEKEVLGFIESTPKLSSITLGNPAVFPTEDIWPTCILNSLAKLPVFWKLQGQNLTSEILHDLPKNSFPALKHLAVGYVGPISTLPPLFPHLTHLDLVFLEPIEGGFEELAKIFSLTTLRIEPADNINCTISGPELIAIANGCPHLTRIQLPQAGTLMAGDPGFHSTNLNDASIDEFARSLPLLETLCIGLTNESALTHQSIISLARHCPQLGNMHITADISVPDLIEGLEEVRDVPFPCLMFLRIYTAEVNAHMYEGVEELARVLVKKLAPKLCEFQITGGSDCDEQFYERVEELIAGEGYRR